MLPLNDYRSYFPYIQTGRIYLNHAATAPLSTYVIDRINNQLDFRSRGVIENFRETLKLINETRQLASSMLHCSPERIAFVQNTSDGLNILAGGIDWKTGDRILLNDIEFPSNVYPFLNQKRHGIEIDFIKNRNGMILLEDIEQAITPRTKLLSISWVQFLSGFKCDLSAISALCRKHEIIFCVDAIQGLGAQQLDLSQGEIDFLSSGAQKWLLAPQGIALIYISEELQSRLVQQNVGWLGVKNSWDFLNYDLNLLDSAQRYESATYNTFGVDGFYGSLSLFQNVGFKTVEKLVNENAALAFHLLKEHNFDLITPEDRSQRAGIVTFKHERSEDIFRHLASMNIDVSYRLGSIRISPHFYNTKEEIERTVEIICEYVD